MKYSACTLAILCMVLSPSLIAGTQEQPLTPGQEKAQAVAQILNLSPQQESQLEPILKAEKPKVQAIMQDSNLSPSEKKLKLQHIHSESDPLVKSILNPTQYKQWQTIRNDELENLGLKK